MNALTKVAEFLQSRTVADMTAERFDRVKRHVVDTWAARVAGSHTDEGRAVGDMLADDPTPNAAIVAGCAQARCTEIDDIHLTSCTTPGAVVVPTALALVCARADRESTSAREFCAAVLAGYEAMIRLGVAIDGPAVLHKGVWPTAFAAPFGSAATASRLLGLTSEETASALATSLTFAQQRAAASSPARSSRWLSLGVAAASGVMAARGARAGLAGVVDAGAWANGLTRGLGRRYLFDAIGMKPFPTARQALAAIDAAQGIVHAEQLRPDDIDDIAVAVPERQRVIIDRRAFPRSRFESIVNVRYQIAVAIAAPDRLADVQRTPVFDDTVVRALMAKVRVRRGRELEERYPRSWPAIVTIVAGGRRRTRTVLHARGDARNPIDWDALGSKVRAIAAPVVGHATVDAVISAWRRVGIDARMPALP